ncbi:MAG: hypothetical protein E6Q33_04435 [Neisseriales bacterium]|nr:MAG: hypothetical protein E6Q33_04435 [Neisseriales bacterium]
MRKIWVLWLIGKTLLKNVKIGLDKWGHFTDVDQFPGHIACSSLAKSEIVVPLKTSQAKIIGVLDVDSTSYAEFDDIDKKYLEELINTPELIKVFDNYHA